MTNIPDELGPETLSDILRSIHDARDTGILHLSTERGDYAYSFLFGHLFDAAGPDADGEECVIATLRFDQGGLRFAAREQLPARETVRCVLSDLEKSAGVRE